MAGRPSFKPTPEQRRNVQGMIGYGVSQQDIAVLMEISEPTLRKHFRRELDTGMIVAHTKAKAKLYERMMKDDHDGLIANMFFLKTQCGWRETDRHEITGLNGGPIETLDLTGLTVEQKRALAALKLPDEDR